MSRAKSDPYEAKTRGRKSGTTLEAFTTTTDVQWINISNLPKHGLLVDGNADMAYPCQISSEDESVRFLLNELRGNFVGMECISRVFIRDRILGGLTSDKSRPGRSGYMIVDWGRGGAAELRQQVNLSISPRQKNLCPRQSEGHFCP